VDAADAYLVADAGYHAIWAALDADQKARSLVSSTRHLQALRWKSGEAPDIDTPPANVIAAASLLAAMISEDPAIIAATASTANAASGQGEVKRVKAGSAEVEFFQSQSSSSSRSVSAALTVPDRIRILLGELLGPLGNGRMAASGSSPYDASVGEERCPASCESGLTGSI